MFLDIESQQLKWSPLLVSHEAVAEAAVVGAKDEMTGQGIVAFVILRGGIEAATG